MKRIFIFAFTTVFTLSCIRVDTTEAPATKTADKDGVFIHISKGAGDVHEVLMGLMLADKFSTSHDVLLFFDIDGIEMVSGDAANLELDPFDPSDKIFERLVSRGVTILACPACMKVSGLDENDLRKGVIMAEKEMFFDFTDGRILSLDY